MSKSKNNDLSGLMLFMLFLTFMVLKLTNVIDWSWWYVTMPLWAGVAIVLALLPFKYFLEYKLRKLEEKKYEAYKKNPDSKSKFMAKLEEAMKASEEKRNQN